MSQATTFQYNNVTYHVREKLGRDVLGASRLGALAIAGIYGEDMSFDDEAIDWNTVQIVIDTAQRVSADGGILPTMPEYITASHLLAVYGAMANAPVAFVEALIKALRYDGDPNATSTPIE